MPTYDIECPNCGTYERLATVPNRKSPCEKCGAEVQLLITSATSHRGFEPYFDMGLGVQVNGAGDRRVAMRKLSSDYRDPPSPGDRSVRLDKINEKRKHQRAAR